MKETVNLHLASLHRGPGRVAENLIAGLQKQGIDVTACDEPRKGVYQGCLQATAAIKSVDDNTLMGPNLFVLPSEWGDYTKKFNHFVVPSLWVKNKYLEFDSMQHASIDVWPVGIATDIWNRKDPVSNKTALIYFKNRQQHELDAVKDSLTSLGWIYNILTYGAYEEKDLFEACQTAQFCVILTNTESQGIAYMQILSMNVPCLVFNKNTWNNEGRYKQVPATSVPYFDDSCGLIKDAISNEDIEEFTRQYQNFSPRSFIVENFNLERQAQEYMTLLRRYQNV